MLSGRCFTAALCFLLAGAATGRAGETYHDHEHHFHFELPDGWTKMPAEQLEAFRSPQENGEPRPFTTGFVTASDPLGTPYLPVRVYPVDTAGADYEHIRGMWTKKFSVEVQDVEGTTFEQLQKTPFEAVTMNASANRVVFRSQKSFALGKADAAACIHMGSEEFVYIWGFNAAEEAEVAEERAAFLPILAQINDSFAFDSDAYVFAPAFRLKSSMVIGAIAGLTVLELVIWMALRQKKAKAETKRKLAEFEDLQFEDAT